MVQTVPEEMHEKEQKMTEESNMQVAKAAKEYISDLHQILSVVASLSDKVDNMDPNRDRVCQCVLIFE